MSEKIIISETFDVEKSLKLLLYCEWSREFSNQQREICRKNFPDFEKWLRLHELLIKKDICLKNG